MNIVKTEIDGVLIIEPHLFRDARGYFFESFCKREFEEKVTPILGHSVHFCKTTSLWAASPWTKWWWRIITVKMQGRSAWEYLGKFFTKSLIKRIESSSLEFLSVKTLSNVFNGCRDFFSLRPDKFSCQRVQSQTCLSYADCSRKSWNKSDWQYANIFDKWEQWKLAFGLSSGEKV